MAERRPKKKYNLPPMPAPEMPQPAPMPQMPMPQMPPIQPVPEPVPYPVPVPVLQEYCSVDPWQLWETYRSSRHTTKMLKQLIRQCQTCCPPPPPPCDGPWSGVCKTPTNHTP
ncbi:hypothetical protein [Marininema halotolerans]|uniref:Uncharacterized protein n=1 Tax=Marininema halotolerans TaxID=1155944 RepID=A0A1I6RKJ4_9BACL|nr:hypothetical protein [Marininema halotolerans]SFS64988.1 hypothetical protein SAMN05444972_105145 [Marininema halotolerans]